MCRQTSDILCCSCVYNMFSLFCRFSFSLFPSSFSSSSYSSSKFLYPFILYLLIFLASRTHFLAVAHAGPMQGLVFPLLQESY